ncbi:MAG: YihY family inner membrane protein [Spirochaetales bacterium]|nr:YihY family inner membrane protein [Spirochaetales bacterium]
MNVPDWGHRLVRFTTTVVKKIISDQLFFRATSLAFTTVMSMVPLTMVIFSFGGFQEFGTRTFEALSQFLVPEGNDEILRAFNTFTSNSRRLSTWGSILFIFAAIMLMNAMEMHMNSIFRSRPRRGFIRRLGSYAATLSLTSLMFGAGGGPLSEILVAWSRATAPEQRIIGGLLSIAGVMVGLYLLFRFLNGARVRVASALLGAFVGALVFQAAKFGFSVWTVTSVRQSVIYGSVVFIPKLLIWLDVAWIIILIAAEITYAHQIGAGKHKKINTRTPAGEIETGWQIYLALAEDHREGRKPPGIRDLAHRLSADVVLIDRLMVRLSEEGLVHPVAGHPPGYVPAIAPADLAADRVISALGGWSIATDEGEISPHIRAAISARLKSRTVRSFLTYEVSQCSTSEPESSHQTS